MSSSKHSLPPGWAWASLGDVTHLKISQERPARETTFSYIDISSIDNKAKTIIDVRKVPAAKAPSRARQRVCAGDVLVSLTRPNLNAVALVPSYLDASIASTGFDVLRPIHVDPAWIFAVVRSESFVAEMSRLVQGALYPAIRPHDVRNFKFPLPPQAEQRRIISKIETLGRYIGQTKEVTANIIDFIEEFRRSVLTVAFRGDLTLDWRKAHTSTEPAKRLLNRIRAERKRRWEESLQVKGKASENYRSSIYQEPEPADGTKLPELPEGWTWATLAELTDPVRVIRYGILMPGPETAGGIPYVKVLHMRGDTIDVEALPRTSPEIHAKFYGASLKNGDILLSIRGTYGRVAEVPKVLEGANITQDSARIAPLPGVQADFLSIILRSPQMQAYFSSIAKGVAVRGLNIGEIRSTPIPLAPEAEQKQIAKVVKEKLTLIDAVNRFMRQIPDDLQKLEASIYSKAFRGELVPQHPDDEPASVLLERIRAKKQVA